ncbi:hypothetical protein S40285_07501 [Stachybotrys chlorohalonatus IBT 40285]|uniref:GAT domain-containing protein n=1 Tax=Stachybotrys chlorohalonatus (strain IBT 40285) TaxID=1283841 RepID=A0A084QGI0_STAC4|nr:hypothetical protein S40285_07501 [Stachybotrys chlorohalonata IBT 40285]
MKSMKALNVSKVLGRVRRKGGNGDSESSIPSGTVPGSTPEITARNSVKAFCESGGSNRGDDVLFLPPIVDAAESSPTAAAECAYVIRKFLGKDYSSRPSWQYNAIMLVRILSDNPGPTFTRALDQKFVDAAKALLKNSKDPSVRQILMETLDDFQHTKQYDENLQPIVSMWKKEKEKALKDQGGRPPPLPAPSQNFQTPPLPPNPINVHSQNYFARSHRTKSLPEPVELASRLEEARTSAKLLEQVVMNTPPVEMLNNELIKEFADRCLSASRSIQGYMVSTDPVPDNDTMESLIDTNEQLQTALNQHQRAVLSARKSIADNDATAPSITNGSSQEHQGKDSPSVISAVSEFGPVDKGKGRERAYKPYDPEDGYDAPAGPPPGASSSRAPRDDLYEDYDAPTGPPPGASSGRAPRDDAVEDPFADPSHDQGRERTNGGPPSAYYLEERLAYEPFHPGFGGAEDSNGAGGYDRGKAIASGAGGGSYSTRPDYHVSDDEDAYEAQGRGKEPSSRV